MTSAAIVGDLGILFHFCAITVFGIAMWQWKHCKKRLASVEVEVGDIKSGIAYKQMQKFMEHVMDVARRERELLDAAQKSLADERARVARLLHTGLS